MAPYSASCGCARRAARRSMQFRVSGVSLKRLRKAGTLLNGIERNIEAHVFALLLIGDGGRIDAVECQIVAVQPMSGEANRSLVAGAVIDGADHEAQVARVEKEPQRRAFKEPTA
jgi:hypothetical protein